MFEYIVSHFHCLGKHGYARALSVSAHRANQKRWVVHFCVQPCSRHPTISSLLLANRVPFIIFPTSDISEQQGLFRLRALFEAALDNYEKQTGIALAKHPLAEQPQNTVPVEPVTDDFRNKHKPSAISKRGTKS
jgi:hypothetical protein